MTEIELGDVILDVGCASTDTVEGDDNRGAIKTGVVVRQIALLLLLLLILSRDPPSDCARPRPVFAFAPAPALALVLGLVGPTARAELWIITDDDKGIGMGETIMPLIDWCCCCCI